MNLILGGGIPGLSIGWGLEERRQPYVVVERESIPGGLCRSVHLEVKGKGFFHFDLAGHVLHLRSPEIKSRLAPFLKTCLEFERKAWIWMNGSLIPYPFQAHIAQLPPAQAEECLTGFLRAWAKPVKSAAPSFAEWAEGTFGGGIYKYFMEPYNEKLWTVPLEKLTCEWMGRFVPSPTLEEIAKGFVEGPKMNMGYNPVFYYPKEGGIEGLVKWMRGRLAPRHLHTGATVIGIDPVKREVRLSTGEAMAYQRLFSTLPLPDIVKCFREVPTSVRSAVRRLSWNSLEVLYLALNHPVQTDRHWVYMPEREYPFYRVGFPSNLAPRNAPSGCGSLLVERAVKPGQPIQLEVWAKKVIGQLVALKWIKSRDAVLAYQSVRLPYAYVVYTPERREAVETIRGFLERHGVTTIGRYGSWEYSSIEDNIVAGLAAAK